MSASWQLTDRLIPFACFGRSDGGAGETAESDTSIGFEFAPRNNQAWSLGTDYAKTSKETPGPDLDDEYVIETSYKF